jgi:hypothetical protein
VIDALHRVTMGIMGSRSISGAIQTKLTLVQSPPAMHRSARQGRQEALGSHTIARARRLVRHAQCLVMQDTADPAPHSLAVPTRLSLGRPRRVFQRNAALDCRQRLSSCILAQAPLQAKRAQYLARQDIMDFRTITPVDLPTPSMAPSLHAQQMVATKDCHKDIGTHILLTIVRA